MAKWFYICAVALLGWTAPARAAQPVVLDWSDLPDPAVQAYDNPFLALSAEQFDDLRFSVRLRDRLQQEGGSAADRQKWQMMLTETEAALAADQIDVDDMLVQGDLVLQRRDRAANAGNPELDGQIVTLSGYAIPAPPDTSGQNVVYLVPKPGMCSHLPAPPPNQMIRVWLNDDWTPNYMHEHVQVTGLLAIDPTEQVMNVVDGPMPMRATFEMKAETVEPLHELKDPSNWLHLPQDTLRGAGYRKSGGGD